MIGKEMPNSCPKNQEFRETPLGTNPETGQMGNVGGFEGGDAALGAGS
jgi:hypothetical protein